MTTIAVRCPARTIARVAPSFSTEVQLAEPVRSWLSRQRGVVGVGDEIDAGFGIADLVAGCSTCRSLPTRPTFLDPLALGVLELARDSVSEADLQEWAPHGWRSLQRRVVEPLLMDGHLCVNPSREGEATYIATVAATDPFNSLVAVELKLRDWRRAVAQAGRYRLFAERSFVALPTSRVNTALQAEARRNRVGVLAVDDDGSVDVVVAAPMSGPLQPLRRRWASEQLLGALRHPGGRVAGSPMR